MAALKGVFVGCMLLLVVVTFTDATMCYKCNHVAHPRDCDTVVKCNSGEKCHVLTYAQADGNYYYTIGCLAEASCPANHAVGKRDLAICNRCCDGDYCNKELCDGPAPSGHGLRCLQCTTVEHPTHCGAVTECALGQVCFTKEKYVFGERRYQLGCGMAGCSPLARYRSIFNRQAGQCQQCCNTENCNRDLCANSGSPLTQAPATVPAYVPTSGHSNPQTQPPQTGTTHVYNYHGCHYRGKIYQTNESWVEGCDFRCTCISSTSGRYVCQDICPTYTNIPDNCHMEKTAGECCSHPVCSGHNITSTNFTSSTLINDCYYKGKTYQQDETWRDGCEFECDCMDATKGYYRCKSLCYTWNLPPKCHLNPPTTGKCCETPSCPAGYIIQYPPGYIEN